MKLVVGLGNPGNDYRGTRHNAGFEVVDALVKRHARDAGRERFGAICWEAELRVDGVQDKVLLMKPLTFMNLSGDPVAQAMRFHKLDAARDLLVVADDLALPVGHIRLRQDGGSGGHNGLADVAIKLSSGNWARLRVGIGKPAPRMSQVAHVLGRFTDEERPSVDASISTASEAVLAWLDRGAAAAMNAFNTKVPAPAQGPKGAGPQTDSAPSS